MNTYWDHFHLHLHTRMCVPLTVSGVLLLWWFFVIHARGLVFLGLSREMTGTGIYLLVN